MKSAGSVIKGLAIALAAFIIFMIVNSLLFAFSIVGSIFNLNDNDIYTGYQFAEVDNSGRIRNLKIDLATTNLTIKKGDKVEVETNNSKIEVKNTDTDLEIKEESFAIFSFNLGKHKTSEVILYLPDDLILDNVDIDLGAGKSEIGLLKANNIKLDAGAGSIAIDNITASNHAEIDGGAGKFAINSGVLNDLDFEMGVGKTDINAVLTGKADIEAGVGEVTINLLDSIDNYRISVEKGIGSVKVNGDEVSNNSTTGNGSTPVKIEAGVGAIKINTK